MNIEHNKISGFHKAVIVAEIVCLALALAGKFTGEQIALPALLMFFLLNGMHYYLKARRQALPARMVNMVTALSSFVIPVLVMEVVTKYGI